MVLQTKEYAWKVKYRNAHHRARHVTLPAKNMSVSKATWERIKKAKTKVQHDHKKKELGKIITQGDRAKHSRHQQNERLDSSGVVEVNLQQALRAAQLRLKSLHMNPGDQSAKEKAAEAMQRVAQLTKQLTSATRHDSDLMHLAHVELRHKANAVSASKKIQKMREHAKSVAAFNALAMERKSKKEKQIRLETQVTRAAKVFVRARRWSKLATLGRKQHRRKMPSS